MRIDRLGHEDTQELARFLLHRMPMETRHQLIAERPTIYAQLLDAQEPAMRELRNGIRSLVLSPLEALRNRENPDGC